MTQGQGEAAAETAGAVSADAWRGALIAADATLREAIANLQETSVQIALVTTPDDELIGTVTDGDIRRGLLHGLDLSSPLESIIRREPFVVPPELSGDAALQLMKANGIHAIPVVNGDRRVVGLHLLRKLLSPSQRPNLMVIMAGGRGSRLRPHTDNCPKPLLPVGGKPILEHILLRAKADGFRRFVLAIHHLGHMVEDYFGDGSGWEVEIEYIREDSPLGTAGAIGLMNPRPQAPFLVSNGDLLTDVRYSELLDFHLRHNAAATMAVRLHEWEHPFGVVRTEGVDITGFAEKPVSRSHVNAGVYVLHPVALDHVPAGELCDMPTLFSRLKEGGQRTIVFPMHEPWLDVGRTDDLERAQADHSPTG